MLMTAVPMLALTASAVEVITEGDFQGLVLADGTVQIIGYNGSDEKLSVPSTLDGRVVTEIGERAFVDNSTIVAALTIQIATQRRLTGARCSLHQIGLTTLKYRIGIPNIRDNIVAFCEYLGHNAV